MWLCSTAMATRNTAKAPRQPTAAERIMERDLGAPIEAHLQSLGYVVSKEVKHLRKIADIVAVRRSHLITIELKTDITLKLITQAFNWTEHVNETWIAVPEESTSGKISDVRAFGYRICRDYGIGVLTVKPLSKAEQERMNRGDDDAATCEANMLARVTIVEPALIRLGVDTTAFHDILRPEHQTFSEAGTKSGLRVGPFQDMCQRVRDYLQATGGGATLESVAKVAKRPSKVVVELLRDKRIPMVRLDGTGDGAAMVRLCKVGEEGVTLSERESKSRPARYVPGVGMVSV